MNTLLNTVLIRNGHINVSKYNNFSAIDSKVTAPLVATLISNMAYYGFVPSATNLNNLFSLTPEQLKLFWAEHEPSFKTVTGADRNMEDFVVYKNFPKEVLNMDETSYWVNQICMYIGVPNEYFTEEKEFRPSMLETVELKVLHEVDDSTLDRLTHALVSSTSRWSDNQQEDAKILYSNAKFFIDASAFSFRENAITLIAHAIKEHNSSDFDIEDATDVLRLCAGLSNGDVSLRVPTKFINFSRKTRKTILRILNATKNLEEDFANRPEQWKRLLSRLHPSDYPQFSHVCKAYDALYNKSIVSYNKIVDGKNTSFTDKIDMVKTRPGDFLRRFHSLYAENASITMPKFMEILPRLSTIQLLKFQSYILSINDRKTLMYAPKGNWSKVRVSENKKAKILDHDIGIIVAQISTILFERINAKFPNGVMLDERLKNVNLQTNDQKLAAYGRGTSFEIPENIKFIRTASYWKLPYHGNVWFDNAWSFFDENWLSLSSCCWNSTHVNNGSVFSGDPTNSKDLKGRACQMIDLYLDKLEAAGIRYAVWNILCYSHIPFSDAEDVLATLQMGENPETGSLYEPSRAQMVFPIKDKSLSKYLAYIDIKERKLIYIDASLPSDTGSAVSNHRNLETLIPAYIEYVNSLPSVYDLFSNASIGDTPVLYSDEDHTITSGDAYVFKSLNSENQFNMINLSEILDDNS